VKAFSPYALLDIPFVYRAAEVLLAPGLGPRLRRLTQELAQRYRLRPDALDVGCGPKTFLSETSLRPVGIDLSQRSAQALTAAGVPALVASADHLPFADGAFATVWSVGLLHHLEDHQARAAVREMVRVAGNGDVVIVDAVLPRRVWTRPLAYAVRRLDRGRHVRSQLAHEALLPDRTRWTTERITCSAIGHEVTICLRARRS